MSLTSTRDAVRRAQYRWLALWLAVAGVLALVEWIR